MGEPPSMGPVSDTYSNILPIEVPILGSYFVLLNAKFASFFFDFTLAATFVNRSCDRVTRYLWCQAAINRDNSHPSCLLVQIVSRKEDSDGEFCSQHRNMIK